MKDFSKVRFKGTFRHYQQKIIDDVSIHLEDKKVHIVAAPGSGKTTLGIELIRYLNKPALILSPSITIRNQWGDRFEKGFLDSKEDVNEYVSFKLKKPKLLTSITYQGLHAAYNKLRIEENVGNEVIEQENEIDFSDFDLIETMKANRITTICLDEAHHLRSEWYKTLVEFIKKIESEITVISLTATPPYDSTPLEWERYMNLCGTIDEEIFVPELIEKKNLCPHQDYIYFNYPSAEEKADLKEYKELAFNTIRDIKKSKEFKKLTHSFLKDYLNPKYNLFEDIEVYITLVNIAKTIKLRVPGKLSQIVKDRKYLNKFDVEHIEVLFKYIIEHPDTFEEGSAYINKILKDAKLIEKKQVNLQESTRLRKTLVSSIGKLRSISEIAKFEASQLKSELRMLILTDYIKKELIQIIGTNENNTVIGAVPIFEEVRRSVTPDIRIALLTGPLIIVPNQILNELDLIAKNFHSVYTKQKLATAPYQIIRFKSSNRDKVKILTQLFEKGHIEILIGTKSLLGEGWDSPSINTLILASFVGSFMLSNQMRGRAIRVDKMKPDKVASIWHLATIEPSFLNVEKLAKSNKIQVEDEKTTIISHDFATLTRRFKSFLGPAFKGKGVESGINRVDIIKPPFTEQGFNHINETMLKYAADRKSVSDKWVGAVNSKYETEILDASQVPPKVWPFEIFMADAFLIIIISLIAGGLGYFLFPYFMKSDFGKGFGIFYLLVYLTFLFIYLPKALGNLTPKRSVHTLGKILLNTLRELDSIRSPKAKVITKRNFKTRNILCSLANGTRRDKSVFAASINEIMTQIENPRYVIIKKRKIGKRTFYNYSASYSVPKDIGAKKENVELFAKKLKRVKGVYSVVYTRSVEGRLTLVKCKEKSRLSRHLIRVENNRMLRTKA